jgi:transcriptional regulator with XRE-family HTH domain
MAKNPNFVDVHVGKRVKKRRQALGLSQEALGDGVGLTFQQIQKYEKGTNRISSSRLQQFAQILKVDVPWFFDEMPGAKKVSAKAEPLDYVDEFTAEAGCTEVDESLHADPGQSIAQVHHATRGSLGCVVTSRSAHWSGCGFKHAVSLIGPSRRF